MPRPPPPPHLIFKKDSSVVLWGQGCFPNISRHEYDLLLLCCCCCSAGDTVQNRARRSNRRTRHPWAPGCSTGRRRTTVAALADVKINNKSEELSVKNSQGALSLSAAVFGRSVHLLMDGLAWLLVFECRQRCARLLTLRNRTYASRDKEKASRHVFSLKIKWCTEHKRVHKQRDLHAKKNRMQAFLEFLELDSRI